jgi:poly-beta-1,6-N-acetyl-D-glucosamine synthase
MLFCTFSLKALLAKVGASLFPEADSGILFEPQMALAAYDFPSRRTRSSARSEIEHFGSLCFQGDDQRRHEEYMNTSIAANFVIITPVYNEAGYIERTIESVLAQTVKPSLWLIVDDGSTDRTAEIIKKYTSRFNWIRSSYREKVAEQSYYSSNVYAILSGYAQIHEMEIDNADIDYENRARSRGIDFTYLAILDGDISLPPDYYEQILRRMGVDGDLGIASGIYVDRIGDNQFRKAQNDRRSTPKAIMVFRRECYEDIGGFIPLKHGGEDTCACFTARMRGWKTWSFPDIVVIHNKPIGMGHSSNILQIRYRQGAGEYYMATHPLFMLIKSLRRCLVEYPFIIGGLARLTGYVLACLRKEDRQISGELMSFIRNEQLGRVLRLNSIPENNRS